MLSKWLIVLDYILSIRYPKTDLISDVTIDGYQVDFYATANKSSDQTEVDETNKLSRDRRILDERDNSAEDLDVHDYHFHNHEHSDIDEEERGNFNTFLLPVTLEPRENKTM